jgi:hypothetical protein
MKLYIFTCGPGDAQRVIITMYFHGAFVAHLNQN